MIKSFLVLLLLTITIFIGCAGNVVSIPDDSLHYTILADEHLQTVHKLAILDAASEWAEKTNNTLTYDLQYVDMSKQPKDLNTPNTIRIYVQDPGPNYLGWTDWLADNRSAYIEVEPSINGELFRRIMLHEFGHAFNLSFNGDAHYTGPYQSVMHPGLYDDSLHVSCPELIAFCNNYGCQVDCNYELIPTN